MGYPIPETADASASPRWSRTQYKHPGQAILLPRRVGDGSHPETAEGVYQHGTLFVGAV